MTLTRFGDITAKLAVIGAVFTAGLLTGGAVMGISLAAGVSVAVVGGDKATRCWRRSPDRLTK